MDNEAGKKVISWLLLSSIFINGSKLGDLGFTVEWYHFIYIPFAVICLIRYHRFDRSIGSVLVGLFVWSLVTFQYGFPLVVKQIVNIAFSAFVFYNYLIWENFNYQEIFRKYCVLSKVVLVIGFLQVIVFALEPYGFPSKSIFFSVFPFLSETPIAARFQSVTSEPSFLAYAFGPVVFLSLYNIFFRRSFIISGIWSVFFVIGYILTFSLVAYAGLLLMILVLYFKDFNIVKLSVSVFVFALLGAISFYVYDNVPEIKLRMDDTFYGFRHEITDEGVYRSVNLTTYVLLSNEYVTKRSLHDQPVAGTGLGTYELTYDRYLPADMKAYSHLNREDAGGMAFRLLTETGIMGLVLFGCYLFGYRVKAGHDYPDAKEIYWIMNAGIFILIILFLIRNGNYTSQAKMLFFFLYYFTYKAARNE